MSLAFEDDIPGTAMGRLLVVDDDEANRDLLSRRLERKGHAVLSADGGRRALEMLAVGEFDLVLLDVMMPEMSGLDVLEVIRRTRGPAELPVVMATARHLSEDIVEALRMGANDYVTKPLDFPVVLARVQTQLLMKRAVEEAARLERRLAERNRELEEVNARLEAANRRMERDLKAAARVQGSFLPRDSPDLPGARCAWFYRPCDELAGDGLNAFSLGGGLSGLYVFDVSGHGVASSLLSVSLSRVLSPPGDPSSVLAPGPPPAAAAVGPAEVADRLNLMFPFDQADQYFTLIYGVLDAADGRLRYVTAGHPGLALLPGHAGGGEARVIEARGYPVGLAPSAYEERSLAVAPGDRVYFYSDGVPEAMDPSGKAFGNARMLDSLTRGRSLSLPESVEGLAVEVARWCAEAGLRDDVSVLGFELAAAGGPGEA